jgi:hypothetical protein
MDHLLSSQYGLTKLLSKLALSLLDERRLEVSLISSGYLRESGTSFHHSLFDFGAKYERSLIIVATRKVKDS